MFLGKIRMSDFPEHMPLQSFNTTYQLQPKNSEFNSRTPHLKNDIVIVSKKVEYKSILAIERAD